MSERLKQAAIAAMELLISAEDHIDTYVDVDDGEDGQPVANHAMNAQTAIRDAMSLLALAVAKEGQA